MRALVIGADGFAGRWLVRHLSDAGDDVVAVVGPSYRPPLDGIDSVVKVDVRDGAAVAQAVGEARPEVVYNLAGISRAEDREQLELAVGVSIVGSLNALMACARQSPPPRLLFVSTAYVYAATGRQLAETSAVAPDSVYAAAKLAAEHTLMALGPASGVEVVVARPFNHIGPGQADSFVVPGLARQVAEIAAGAAPPRVHVADPGIVRDFTDVRDVVAGYRILALRGEAGAIYNVASGTGTSVADLAQAMAVLADISIHVVTDGDAVQRDEARVLLGDARRLQALGWRREYSLRDTLADVLRSATRRRTEAPA